MMSAEQFVRSATDNLQRDPDGRWRPAKPHPGPLRWRIRDAWAVLRGRAEAVTFEAPRERRS